MIELKNLNKTYPAAGGPIPALEDINLTIRDGEIFGIIGLSGAGKSTLVRCINLLERPTSGEIVLDGQELTALSQKELLRTRRRIGMIFQNFNLFEQRSVLQNVCYPLEIAGVRRKEARRKAEALLELVGLADRMQSYPSQLSGGQKQRVAIARALATDPAYLLCDEATSALDPTTTQSILQLLRQINQTMHVTILVITHEMKVIEQICDRVAVIHERRIAEVGEVQTVFAHPQSAIARELILPQSALAQRALGNWTLRVLFDGERADRPVLAEMILACGVPVNILFADTRELDGKACGQMLLQLPEEQAQADRILGWLNQNGLHYTEEADKNGL